MSQVQQRIAGWPRALVAVLAGLATAAFAYVGDLPGDGAFLLVAAFAGLVAGLVASCWKGWACLVGAIAVGVAVPAAAQQFSGLWALVIGALAVPATAGWLIGHAIVRTRRIGLRGAVRDPIVLAVLAGVIAILWLIWYLAGEFATNPP